MTASDIRKRILDVVSRNGGHLASSLGAVELSMALAEEFDPMADRIVWDVGHQAYAWKLLTDRGGRTFDTLRQTDGMAPFPTPAESTADAAVAGHAGVALSVAEGLAAARDAKGTGEHVVAVIGDAAVMNGTSLEALCNLTTATRKMIVVLNDNNTIIPPLSAEEGRFSANAFFTQFGLRYIGPVDGHDIDALRAALATAKEEERSVIVHALTQKGRGYAPAEADPAAYHALPAADSAAPHRTWSEAFGDTIVDLARRDERIIALTAGMKEGTWLGPFADEFSGRFFDVGISEGHMVAFAAGLAAGGMRPVVAVYSSFLQRAVDQVMHDVCLPKLPVVFCVDRAGVVGGDGATHQGVFDIAMLRCLPGLTIEQPCDESELAGMLAEAIVRDGPTVIRYPRGAVSAPRASLPRGLAVPVANPEAGTQIWATGDMLEKAMAVSGLTGAGVVYARSIKPFDEALLRRQREAGRRIASIENGSVAGGFGEAIGADIRFGWPDAFVPHGSVGELERRCGLDVESIAARLRSDVSARENRTMLKTS
ncbi:MAG: 1-deoxy-D-xylulose-5-phosphate synthase [Kiritimatiellae bacterium]|nr:1-deoxy-D-xylulose-5-phosphate synthase [Kiritimatiellia bacterium]